MGASKNKTRQTLFPVAIQKPMKEWIELRDGIFVSLVDWYIVPATSSTVIEWIATNDIINKEQIKEPSTVGHDRMCYYFPKRRWETFTMDVENGEITQEDVGQTFLIVGELQHINYNTKAERWGQFRLEQVITPTRWEFTYYFDSSLSPQGPKGEDWETPTFTFSPVQTLPVGSDANLIVTPEWNNYDLTFQIPAGANWKDWKPGAKWAPWEKWDTVDLRIGEVTGWQTPAANIRTVTPTMRELDLTLPKGEDWEDWLSPTPRNDWSSAYVYNYLDIVRYPDQDWIWCSWIWKYRDTPSTTTDIPGESDWWMLLNIDWEPGPKGEDWGTVVIPVEWKPGKDGAPGAPGEKGNDWKSPHNEWEWSSSRPYTELAMVRASTWEYDPWGNEIFWYYITQGWVSAGQAAPKDNSRWQLLSKDGMAGFWNIYSAMVFIADNQQKHNGNFDADWNGTPQTLTWTHYTGNPDMISKGGNWILITRSWHYKIYGHAIVQNNTGSNKYINLWRAAICLTTSRNGWTQTIWLGTAKEGGAYSTSQWPWVDLALNWEADLYEWDILTIYYRAQTDTPEAAASRAPCQFTFIGSTDPTGDQWTYLWGLFATYIGVEMITRKLWQENSTLKTIASI